VKHGHCFPVWVEAILANKAIIIIIIIIIIIPSLLTITRHVADASDYLIVPESRSSPHHVLLARLADPHGPSVTLTGPDFLSLQDPKTRLSRNAIR
jgi:hypothetical protein